MTSSVLVTGGAGFIGSHLVRRLLAEGRRVRVVDNLSTGFRQNLQEVEGSIDFVEADVCDPDVCAEAVKGVEVVFHVAALPSVPRSMADPVGTHNANVNATLNLLEAARRAGTRRFVYSSSSSAYGDTPILPKVESMEPLPRSPYAAAKLSGELYTLSYARAGLIEGVALRYFNVFGPRQDPNGPYAAVVPLLFRAVLTGMPITIFGDGLQTRDFTYVDNVVDANMLAATQPAERASGHVVNVGTGSRVTLLDLVRLAEEVSGRSIAVQHVPERAGDVRDSQAGLERAGEVLGYRPRVSIRDGLQRLWKWYGANPSAVHAVARA
jgi:UDP-N-acetylglucosamine/UDP-N-acetyl-alpha-D-glucosaminouronate 4-epimerase